MGKQVQNHNTCAVMRDFCLVDRCGSLSGFAGDNEEYLAVFRFGRFSPANCNFRKRTADVWSQSNSRIACCRRSGSYRLRS